jgi:hypothetical protein
MLLLLLLLLLLLFGRRCILSRVCSSYELEINLQRIYYFEVLFIYYTFTPLR